MLMLFLNFIAAGYLAYLHAMLLQYCAADMWAKACIGCASSFKHSAIPDTPMRTVTCYPT